MSAPTGRLQDPSSVSFYAPKGERAIRLADVSEAAGALIPQSPCDERASLAPGDITADAAVKQLRPHRSLDPEIVPEPPMPLNSAPAIGAIVRFALIVVAAVIAAFVAVGGLPLQVMWGQHASLRPLEPAPSGVRQAQPIEVRHDEPV